MDAAPMVPVSLLGWIDANAEHFQPPVSNKVIWRDSDFIAMVIRGPNARNDFHIDPRDEIFHQIKGDIRVDLMIDGQRETRIVKEGELLLVPRGVPHAPLRPADTWGMVIEQVRTDDEVDELVWFCDECGEEITRRSFHLSDIETELAAALNEVNASEDERTCPNGHVLPVAEPFTMDPATDGGASAN